MFEKRREIAPETGYYVADSVSGHLAHVDRDGGTYAARGMEEAAADALADRLNRETWGERS